MEAKVEEQLLFDFYGELLTETQNSILTYYYDEDLSMAEIASLTGRSRQNVYDILRRSKKFLYRYEERLGLLSRFLENRKRIKEVRNELNHLIREDEKMSSKDRVEELKRILRQLKEIEES